MAMSTIFEEVCISDPEMASAFTDAFLAAMERPMKKPNPDINLPMRDIEEIKKLMSKRFPE